MKTQSMEIEPRPRFAEWLIAPMRRNRATFIKVALAAAMINIFGLVTSLFTMVVYDRVVPNNAFDSLIALTIGLAIVVIFDFALRLLRSYFVDHAGANIDRDVGEAVFARLMAIRLELKTGSTGALTGLMRELETLREFFTSATLVAVVDVPFILLTLAVIALIGGPVVLVPLTMVPLVMLAGWLTHPAMDRLSASAMKQGFLKQGVLVEAVSGLETVKSIGAGPLLARRWTAALDEHSDVALRQRLVGAIATTVAASANTISFAGVIIVGVNLIAEREMTPGALIACSILAGRAIAPLAQVATLLSRIAQTRSSYKQLAQLMALPPEGPAADALTPARVAGAIEFRNVDFRYPGATEKALDNVSFTIKPGERVALLGRIGCGKSTIGRLLLGLYPAESGVVLIDGSDVRQFDPALLRASIGAALQDNYLVSGSVRENIALERPEVDDEELLRASNVSGTHQFIGQITNGYDLKLADRGEGLSGGQRQSISIARALAGRPPILLLDEPTSAMDNQTESGLIDRLAIELKGRTLVLITHRPQMLKLVDRIILIDRGKVMADGPRDKVVERLSGRKAVAAA